MRPLAPTRLLAPVLLLASCASGPDTAGNAGVPAAFHVADEKYLALFEVIDGRLVHGHLRDTAAGDLGRACWERLTTLFPARYRTEIVQFNVLDGRRWAGILDGDGSNDVGRPGYRLSVARYLLESEEHLLDPRRAPTPRRGTLDWTIVHEMGHAICLREDPFLPDGTSINAIELFSQHFDGDSVPQPERRADPDDYPDDGAPKLTADFVTSYAERHGGDEEVVECFTTYVLVPRLPGPDTLAARKVLFFDRFETFRSLRDHVQSLAASTRAEAAR